MRFLQVGLAVLLINGCSFASRVTSMDENTLCQQLGKDALYENTKRVDISRNEIEQRKIDKNKCEIIANKTIERLTPKYKYKYKLKLCQKLASYHYKGAYEHFKNTLEKIERRGFADKECTTMADFYYIRLTHKQAKAQAIASALNQAAENMRRTNEQLYGPGTYLNPVHIKLH